MKKSLILSVVTLTSALIGIAHFGVEAAPDAVSAASLELSASKITATTADILITKDRYNYGTRTLCYDPAPATPTHNCKIITAVANTGKFSITGLTPNTKYNYNVNAIDTRDGERPYNTSGIFTTLSNPSPVLFPRATLPIVGQEKALTLDALGRNLPSRELRAKLKALKIIR